MVVGLTAPLAVALPGSQLAESTVSWSRLARGEDQVALVVVGPPAEGGQ